MDPYYVDLQYQPLALAWKSLDGTSNKIVFDYAVETEDGHIILGEDKASEAFFSDPPLKTRLDFAEEVLRQYDVKLERRTAGGLPSALERRVVKDHFDARLTRFSEHDADRIQNLIRERGGTVPLGALLQALGTCPNLGLLMASAMMLRRKIAMPLSRPPMLSTPITIPRPANKGALRAFLARFAQTPTVSKGRRRA